MGNANVGRIAVSVISRCATRERLVHLLFVMQKCLSRTGKENNMESYTTQMDAARQGIITPQMQLVAEKEHRTAEEIRAWVAA